MDHDIGMLAINDGGGGSGTLNLHTPSNRETSPAGVDRKGQLIQPVWDLDPGRQTVRVGFCGPP